MSNGVGYWLPDLNFGSRSAAKSCDQDMEQALGYNFIGVWLLEKTPDLLMTLGYTRFTGYPEQLTYMRYIPELLKLYQEPCSLLWTWTAPVLKRLHLRFENVAGQQWSTQMVSYSLEEPAEYAAGLLEPGRGFVHLPRTCSAKKSCSSLQDRGSKAQDIISRVSRGVR